MINTYSSVKNLFINFSVIPLNNLVYLLTRRFLFVLSKSSFSYYTNSCIWEKKRGQNTNVLLTVTIRSDVQGEGV